MHSRSSKPILLVELVLVGACLVLSAIGVATILSATVAGRGLGLEVKQIYWTLIGVLALLVPLAAGILGLIATAWLGMSRRRRAAEKHEGLRILR